MQSSYWGYWLVVMGVAIVGLMISVQGITTNTTQDRYAIREMVEASMLESVDYAYYRDYNEIKINKEKFMEVFIRMTAEVMGSNDTYEVNFYAIYEAPPKVSVEVKSNSGTNFIPGSGDYDTTSRIDAIIQIHAEQTTTTDDYVDNNDDGDSDDTPNSQREPSFENIKDIVDKNSSVPNRVISEISDRYSDASDLNQAMDELLDVYHERNILNENIDELLDSYSKINSSIRSISAIIDRYEQLTHASSEEIASLRDKYIINNRVIHSDVEAILQRNRYDSGSIKEVIDKYNVDSDTLNAALNSTMRVYQERERLDDALDQIMSDCREADVSVSSMREIFAGYANLTQSSDDVINELVEEYQNMS